MCEVGYWVSVVFVDVVDVVVVVVVVDYFVV